MARAFRLPFQPVVAHLIPTRRCNLACAYLQRVRPVVRAGAAPVLERRVDALAALGTGIITISGGEPLLHPGTRCDHRRMRGLGMIATVITNGYLLTRDRIARLNRAGLDHLQISIDNVIPDEVSRKSLAVLDQKLQLLASMGRVRRDRQSDGRRGGGELRRTPWSSRGAPWRWGSRRRPGSSTTVAARCGRWATAAAGPRGDREPGDLAVRFLAPQPVSEEPHRRAAQRLAVPGGLPLPLCLRGRTGALVLAAARPARRAAGAVQPGRPGAANTAA